MSIKSLKKILVASNFSEKKSVMYEKSNDGIEIDGKVIVGKLNDGKEISGQEKLNSGNLSHSGHENFGNSNEKLGNEISGHLNSGNFNHSGHERFNSGIFNVGRVNVSH